jgi:hypothetical protein
MLSCSIVPLAFHGAIPNKAPTPEFTAVASAPRTQHAVLPKEPGLLRHEPPTRPAAQGMAGKFRLQTGPRCVRCDVVPSRRAPFQTSLGDRSQSRETLRAIKNRIVAQKRRTGMIPPSDFSPAIDRWCYSKSQLAVEVPLRWQLHQARYRNAASSHESESPSSNSDESLQDCSLLCW